MHERHVFEQLHPRTHFFVKREGVSYAIYEGPPWADYISEENLFVATDEPHVVEVDDFTLIASNNGKVNVLVGAIGMRLRALDMHGEWSNGMWFPPGQRYRKSGITIPDIVEDYERKTRMTIDIITSCTGDLTSLARYGLFDQPKVYMTRGESKGGILVNKMTGGLSLTMQVEDSRDVCYREWLDANKGRLQPERRRVSV